jgi:hypothetical protein
MNTNRYDYPNLKISIEVIHDDHSDVYRFRATDEKTGKIIRTAILKKKYLKNYRIEQTKKNLITHLLTFRKLEER